MSQNMQGRNGNAFSFGCVVRKMQQRFNFRKKQFPPGPPACFSWQKPSSQISLNCVTKISRESLITCSIASLFVKVTTSGCLTNISSHGVFLLQKERTLAAPAVSSPQTNSVEQQKIFCSVLSTLQTCATHSRTAQHQVLLRPLYANQMSCSCSHLLLLSE